MRGWLAIVFSLLATAAVAGFPDFSLSGFSLGGGQCTNTEQSPVFTVTPAEYAFGNTTTGDTRYARFTLTNTGRGTFTNISTSKSAGVFRTYSTTECEAATLSAGNYCRFGVAFTPAAAVQYSYSASVSTNQVPTRAAMVRGTGVGASIITVSNTAVTADVTNIFDAVTRAQSFRSPVTGNLVAFRFKSGNSKGTAPVAAIRCGTSVDLSTSSQDTVAVNAINTVYGVTLSTPIPVTSGQTVYCGVRNTKTVFADGMSMQHSTANPYPDGQSYAAATNWVLNTPVAYDIYFEADFQ